MPGDGAHAHPLAYHRRMPNSTPPGPSSSAPIAMQLEISGRVQGVGYRMAMQALESGWQDFVCRDTVDGI